MQQHLNQELAEKNTELDRKNQELAARKRHIEESQHALVQSEKLAALGQLVAGVAHELNTPLGAIRASVGNLDSAAEETLCELPEVLLGTVPDERADWTRLVHAAVEDTGPRTSREERAARRRLVEELEEAAVEGAEDIAAMLVDIGVLKAGSPHLRLLRSTRRDRLLYAAYNMAALLRNCHNIRTAADRATKIVFALNSYAHPGGADGNCTEAALADNLDTVLTLYHSQLKHGVDHDPAAAQRAAPYGGRTLPTRSLWASAMKPGTERSEHSSRARPIAERANRIDRVLHPSVEFVMSRVRATKAILAVVGFAANAGIPPPVLLSAAKLNPTLLAGPDTDLLHSQELRLWDEAARLTGDQDFGLHLAEWIAGHSEELFDVLAFALRSCATLGDHYRLAGRYMRLVHQGIYLKLEEETDVARLSHGHYQESSTPPRHPVEGMLALSLLQGRRAIGEEFAPQAVCFTHPRPEQVSEQKRIFRAPVHYGCSRNELVLDRALLSRPQPHAEPRLLAMLDRLLAGLLSELPENRSFKDAVRRCMVDELPEREPGMAALAAKLHMSPRSLQRRLQSESTSFAEVLFELRRDLALRYLRDERIAIGEVGFLLGFLDAAAFQRAFKRWNGSTPAQYRRSA